jgi:hypothetical protein
MKSKNKNPQKRAKPDKSDKLEIEKDDYKMIHKLLGIKSSVKEKK